MQGRPAARHGCSFNYMCPMRRDPHTAGVLLWEIITGKQRGSAEKKKEKSRKKWISMPSCLATRPGGRPSPHAPSVPPLSHHPHPPTMRRRAAGAWPPARPRCAGRVPPGRSGPDGSMWGAAPCREAHRTAVPAAPAGHAGSAAAWAGLSSTDPPRPAAPEYMPLPVTSSSQRNKLCCNLTYSSILLALHA